MPRHRIITEDIEELLARTPGLWADLRGASLFITGGTGFFGMWLLEALLAANRRLALDCRVAVLTRDPGRFAAKAPHLTVDKAISFIPGDVRSFEFPTGPVTHVIHAATESSTGLGEKHPEVMFDVCVAGTQRAIALAREKGATRFLLTSSGAVYGRQPPEVSHMPEDYPYAPASSGAPSAYAEGKRGAEQLCAAAAQPHAAGGTVHATIARCYAFVGPHLPLDAHFAIGNFIRDALAGGPIRVAGDGTPHRSYLYAADLVEWLITILLRGEAGEAYNVGSEASLSIRELAQRVGGVAASEPLNLAEIEVTLATKPTPHQSPERYVPNCRRARDELGLVPATSLNAAILRTMQFHMGS